MKDWVFGLKVYGLGFIEEGASHFCFVYDLWFGVKL